MSQKPSKSLNKNLMDSIGSQSDIGPEQNQEKIILTKQNNENENQAISRKKSILVQMDFDQALESVGAANWYQQRAFIIFSIEWFIAAFILLCSPFIFPSPTYNCPHEVFKTQAECQKYYCQTNPHPKDSYVTYGLKTGHYSFTEYYDLTCDNEWKGTLISSISYLGSFLGFTIFPMIADNFGRRVGLFLSWGVCSFGCLMMCCAWFQNGFWLMFIGYFLAGFGVNPAITLHYSFLNEHSIGSFREYTSIGVQVCYALGELFFVLIAFISSNPFYIIIFAFFVPTFIMNFSILFIFESPKFIYERDTLKAIQGLNQIAKVNNKDPIQINSMKSMLKSENEKTYSVVDLFRYKSLTLLSYAASIIFFSVQAVYYGVTFAMSGVGLSIYVNLSIIASAELIAYAITNSFIPYLPRKWTVLTGLCLSGIISVCFLFFPTPETGCEDICAQKILQIIFAALLRFCVCFTWTVVYVYFSELFPTVVRSLALGFTSTAGTLGSFGAPYLVSACKHGGISPLLILGIISFFGAAHVLFLKETKGQPLQNNIQELKLDGEILALEVNPDNVDQEHVKKME